MANYDKHPTSFTQSDGDVEVPTPSYHHSYTQVSFTTDSTTGTLEVFAKYHPLADEEVILEEDGITPLVIALSDPKTFNLVKKLTYSIIFKPTGVDASYTPLISSGDALGVF